MNFKQVLNKHKDIIEGWDSDVGIGDNINDRYYYVWLKRPWVMKIDGNITDAVGFDLPKSIMNKLNRAYQDADAWDKI